MKCYLEPNCVSYNFKKIADTDGKHRCDLNNATYEHDNKHSGDLAKNKSYVYRGAEVDIELRLYNIQLLNIVTVLFCLFFAGFKKVT